MSEFVARPYRHRKPAPTGVFCKKCGSEMSAQKHGFCCLPCQRPKNLEKYHRRKGNIPGVPRQYIRRNIDEYTGRERVKREWDRNNPEKRRAHKLVEKAIERGEIIKQPCSVCGEMKAHAHHDDYSRPMDIMWLCPLHHRRRHAELIAKKEAPASIS